MTPLSKCWPRGCFQNTKHAATPGPFQLMFPLSRTIFVHCSARAAPVCSRALLGHHASRDSLPPYLKRTFHSCPTLPIPLSCPPFLPAANHHLREYDTFQSCISRLFPPTKMQTHEGSVFVYCVHTAHPEPHTHTKCLVQNSQ